MTLVTQENIIMICFGCFGLLYCWFQFCIGSSSETPPVRSWTAAPSSGSAEPCLSRQCLSVKWAYAAPCWWLLKSAHLRLSTSVWYIGCVIIWFAERFVMWSLQRFVLDAACRLTHRLKDFKSHVGLDGRWLVWIIFVQTIRDQMENAHDGDEEHKEA